MKKGERRRAELLERLADHLLTHGLQGASLRPLAAAVGTSDRMLLHYFGDKEELLTASLTLVSQRLITMLDAARLEPLPIDALLTMLAGMVKDPHVRPYMRLWLELLPLAAGGQAPFHTIAQRISATLRGWIADTLQVDTEEQRELLAALTLTIIEGFVMFDALGDDEVPAAALAGLKLKMA
ncbi:TetR/AcrR family transcriptional regulator [Candidatus Chloroploca sp. Khr17]|uniref:TetR/AcrR family transcriptional regulator n=1 Tax=Candidatus Chloroploca sp. Khr17 TaxID=2496869 RepID=UPI00101B7F9F|nr:TetR/AcrR family transcriptional regulator [Candidatus Chloroploca sp. Khr17]